MVIASFVAGAALAQTPPNSSKTGAQPAGPNAKPGQPAAPTAPPPVPQHTPAATPAKIPDLRFDPKLIDRSVDPCVDFYQYACGNWIKDNPIPPDQSRWGRFTQLEERNLEVLRQILEEAAKPDAKRDATTQKIGDYYAACMDVPAIDARALAPIQPELDRIRNLRDKTQLAAEVAHLQRSGVASLFDFGSGQDFKDSNAVIAQADQGGIGLPDRDYYLKDDAQMKQVRDKYLAHVQRMFELAGEAVAQAKADAQTVMRMETDLAKGSLDRVSRRDPEKVYHRMSKQELEALEPAFRWTEYLTDSGSPEFQQVNVAWPDFFKAENNALSAYSLDNWKTYLRWNVLHSEAPLLPTPFVNENFNFYGKTLTGAKELRPRWKRCVNFTDNQLGEALGKKFVERTFGAQGKERTLKMVDAIEKALGKDIESVTWMTPATKQQAEIKLKAITNKIGYPDMWRDYSSVVIKRDDAVGNGMRADQFEFQRQLSKIGQPIDRKEWQMTPPTVNAYYDPQMNNINFPAGILQPPFYDNRADDAVNYGAIGMVIGHELTHGFDDQGRQFDEKGNLRDWWTAADAKAFDQKEACIVQEYSSFTPVDDTHLNGKLTLGENTADNGGLRLALTALLDVIGNDRKPIDGLTPEQRYFLSFGQIWCESQTQESLRLHTQTDPHSPGRFRVNGVVRNMPEFQKAFACKAGQQMAAANACRVW
ncbi:MAG: M13 family metallopeptidase [Acidobacteriia bacterium]|nr:M13 family metallopeptidase [Terriglobia bacterium]MBV8902616.1 M13 family metallopeptidase [Terriglobia bacterium]